VTKRLFIDVDGTLIDKDDHPRPFLDHFFRKVSKDYDVIVWSAGGSWYAEGKIKRLGLEDFVSRFDCKFDMIKKYGIGPGDTCIDDEQNVVDTFLKRGARGYKVPYFESNLAPSADNVKNEYALEYVQNELYYKREDE
jgi:hypothetical protein